MFYIGIDVGVHTGVAVWDSTKREFTSLSTLPIHQAMRFVAEFKEEKKVYVEDARQRKWYGANAQAKQQGAGSVKRDSKIWEDFLFDIGAEFVMVAPGKGLTKWDRESFKKFTGYKGQTSEHSRDAAMLVYGRC